MASTLPTYDRLRTDEQLNGHTIGIVLANEDIRVRCPLQTFMSCAVFANGSILKLVSGMAAVAEHRAQTGSSKGCVA